MEWPEQVEYERIRPSAVFDSSVAERSRQTGTPETTLRRRITSFKSYGMRGLFEPEQFEDKSRLDPEVQALILNLKSDYPPMCDNEIASPVEVLGFLTSVRHRPEDLERAFFSTRFARVLDSSGYARIRHWKIYAEEGLARSEVTLWLGPEVLTV